MIFFSSFVKQSRYRPTGLLRNIFFQEIRHFERAKMIVGRKEGWQGSESNRKEEK
jgi:hypothetical protein